MINTSQIVTKQCTCHVHVRGVLTSASLYQWRGALTSASLYQCYWYKEALVCVCVCSREFHSGWQNLHQSS